MKPITRTLAFLFVAVLLTVPARAQESTANLQPNFVAGQVSRFELWSLRQQHVTMQVGRGSREADTRIEMNGQITWTVDRVEPTGGATCTLVIDWLTLNVIAPDGSVMNNDSRQPRGDIEVAHGMLRAMTGTPLTFTVAADGSILSVRGHEAVNARLPEGTRALPEADFMEMAVGLATLPHAPAEATIGSVWNHTFTSSHDLGWMNEESRYQLAGIEEIAGISVAMVNTTSKLRLEPDLQKMGVPPEVPVTVRMNNASSQGQIMFDLSRREVIGRNHTQSTSIQIETPIPNTPQRIVQTIDETVQSQVLRIAEE